tara:strand:- start:4632 stop:5183 length:552 start_codon:yes stop_codon:yes gene_type:complete
LAAKSILGLVIFVLVTCGCTEKRHTCRYAAIEHSPWNFKIFVNDYFGAVECAQAKKKPILLWFTSYAAQSTRKMEEQILREEKIHSKLRDQFIVVALYVDDKTKLPDHDIDTVRLGNRLKIMKTMGNYNSVFQIRHFKSNTQPLFVTLSSNGAKVYNQFGYLPNAKKVDSILSHSLRQHKTSL